MSVTKIVRAKFKAVPAEIDYCMLSSEAAKRNNAIDYVD
jgi:hypothetical protein